MSGIICPTNHLIRREEDSMSILSDERGGLIINLLLIAFSILFLLAGGILLLGHVWIIAFVLFGIGAFLYPVGTSVAARLAK